MNIQTINLAHKQLGSINYNFHQFSDNQQSIEVLSPIWPETTKYRIVSPMSQGWFDVERILLATAYLKECGVSDIELIVPYFLGARSDRKFTANTVNYMKTVIAPVINAQEYSKVKSLDPHSDVVEACINRFEKIDINPFIEWALGKTDDIHNTAFISPDAGALKRVYSLAQKFNVNKVYVGEKVRNVATGEIVRTDIHIDEQFHNYKDIVVIDDICDGGRTFIELAKVINIKKHPNAKLHLIVTHGIFSKGVDELKSYYDNIFTTNSFNPDANIPAGVYEFMVMA